MSGPDGGLGLCRSRAKRSPWTFRGLARGSGIGRGGLRQSETEIGTVGVAEAHDGSQPALYRPTAACLDRIFSMLVGRFAGDLPHRKADITLQTCTSPAAQPPRLRELEACRRLRGSFRASLRFTPQYAN